MSIDEHEEEPMAWVRYDDQLGDSPKVSYVVTEDPGAMGLHLLANTWTSKQKIKGWVPAHQPIAILYDRGLAQKWADLLVRAGLWHPVDGMCDECAEEYAEHHLMTRGGWVFHNHSDYRPPPSAKQVPGTPSDLSAKRAAAGRAGGRASAARRSGEATDGFAPSKTPASEQGVPTPVPVPDPVTPQGQGQTLFPDPPPAAQGVVATRKLPDDFRFGEFWDAYPHKRDKDAARRAWVKVVRASQKRDSDVVLNEVIAGAGFYIHSREYVSGHPKYPATFLNAGSWRDYAAGPPPERLPGQDLAVRGAAAAPTRGGFDDKFADFEALHDQLRKEGHPDDSR